MRLDYLPHTKSRTHNTHNMEPDQRDKKGLTFQQETSDPIKFAPSSPWIGPPDPRHTGPARLCTVPKPPLRDHDHDLIQKPRCDYCAAAGRAGAKDASMDQDASWAKDANMEQRSSSSSKLQVKKQADAQIHGGGMVVVVCNWPVGWCVEVRVLEEFQDRNEPGIGN